MTHQLWTTKQWKTATDEAVVKALFSPPKHIDPWDFAYLKTERQEALYAYLNILYLGVIPDNVKKAMLTSFKPND